MDNLKVKLINKNGEEIDENSIEYKKVISTLKDLEYIQKDIYDVIKTQNNKIKDINNINENISANMTLSKNNLEICNKYYFSYTPIILGSVIGVIFISPVTAFLGAKYLGITTSLGVIFGGLSGYKIQQ